MSDSYNFQQLKTEKDAHSTPLSVEEEPIIVAFRRQTLLPLDDCRYALQAKNGAPDAIGAS